MAATQTNPPEDSEEYLDYDSEPDFTDDDESIASLQTDDGADHPPEKILAQLTSKNGFVWYLIKWQGCPLLRSSWEGIELQVVFPALFENWEKEKQRQLQGDVKLFDVDTFNKAVLEVEICNKKRRTLRRFKRKMTRVLTIVSA